MAVAKLSTPALREGRRQICQRQGLIRGTGISNHLRECRAQVHSPGARREKAGTMCSVLHRIRKSDQLLVRIEARSKQLPPITAARLAACEPTMVRVL